MRRVAVAAAVLGAACVTVPAASAKTVKVDAHIVGGVLDRGNSEFHTGSSPTT